MTVFPIAGRARWLAAVVLLSIGSGCGQGGQPSEPARAEEALRTVLETWKAGGTPTDLGKRSPAILVKDLDWDGGYRLVSYTPCDGGRLVGFDMNYAVALVLRSPRGKSVKKTVAYTITTRPEFLVLRQEG